MSRGEGELLTAPKPRAVSLLSVCLAVKPVGEPDALIGHVRFDERGWETERCRMAQATAPILDSTETDIPKQSPHVRCWGEERKSLPTFKMTAFDLDCVRARAERAAPAEARALAWARALRLVNYRQLVMKQPLDQLLQRLSAIRRAVFALRL